MGRIGPEFMRVPRRLSMTRRAEFARVRRKGRSVAGRYLVMATLEDPALPHLKLGLIIGAVAGAGFGICEAHRALNYIFASGWDPNYMQFDVVNGFWGIFFTVAGQVAFSALAGYGLARGWGWQFYLIASSLHGLLFMARSGLFPICATASSPHFEYSLGAPVYTAVLAVAVTAWALWLRWRKGAANIEPETLYQ